MCHPLGDLGVTYTVYLWLVKKREVDFLLALIELFFASSYGGGAMSKYWSKLRCLKGGGSVWAPITGKRGLSTNKFWRQKTRVPGLSRGVVCVILYTFSPFDTIPACDTQTHTHTHTDRQTRDHGYYPRSRRSVRVKMHLFGQQRTAYTMLLRRFCDFVAAIQDYQNLLTCLLSSARRRTGQSLEETSSV